MNRRVCPECNGDGTVVHPALANWTAEEIHSDPETFDQMLAGTYDRPCSRCRGRRVIDLGEAEGSEWDDRLADARTMAAESGDWDTFNNPRLGLY